MSHLISLVVGFATTPLGALCVCGLALLFAVCLIIWAIAEKRPKQLLVGGSIVIIVIFGGFLQILTSSTPSSGDIAVILDKDGHVVASTEHMIWLKPGQTTISLARATHAKASVQPITDNPKVRRLEMTLDSEIIDAKKFVEANHITPKTLCESKADGHEADHGPACQQRDAVLFQLYEFMNAHSRELSRFYNPYDPKQTLELENMLHANLDEPLAAKGIRMVRLAKWTTE